MDKSWNQFHVLDASLFDQIKQLIELKNNYKQEWDDIIGITRQRKGEMAPSDLKSVSEMGLMQSSVITDMIFDYFEQFTERELQGVLDYSKFVNVNGVKAIWNQDDFNTALLEIDPNTYCYAELGILLKRASQEQAILNQLKQQIEPLIQQGSKPSTILSIIMAKNVAELKIDLLKIEDMQAAVEQQQAQSEQEAEAMADQRKEQFEKYKHMLGMEFMNGEWDRRDQNTMIKGEYDVRTNGDIPGAEDDEITDAIMKKQSIFLEQEHKREQLRQVERDRQTKERLGKMADDTKREQIASQERIAGKKIAVDKIKARRTPVKS